MRTLEALDANHQLSATVFLVSILASVFLCVLRVLCVLCVEIRKAFNTEGTENCEGRGGVVLMARISYRERKFFRSCIPTSVRTDSGWNCTPSTGILRWRRPMMIPLVCAEISRSSGNDFSSTISE